ncbi:MAG: M28 family peptidase, partial [Flavobacteriaceae bacterium]|nr:M28 family peptidase [Flavobacteriaceae bacterium]
MKKIVVLLFVIGLVSCNTAQTNYTATKKLTRIDYANTITAENLKTHLYQFADDKMQGRMTGEPGQKMAAEYLKNFYISQGITSPWNNKTYFQAIPAEYFGRQKEPKPSENVVAFIKGSEKPDEVIVLSAHYDHVGMRDGEIYNGADDDGSGTVSLLEIAEAFQKAVKDGNGPKRSLLFLHVTGEEIGLYGSKYYTENPIFPLENTVCNLNTDMVGRIAPE